MLKKQGELRIF